jgi:hypothetical protein
VVVKIDQPVRWNRTYLAGCSIEAAGGKFHGMDLYHGQFGPAIKKAGAATGSRFPGCRFSKPCTPIGFPLQQLGYTQRRSERRTK